MANPQHRRKVPGSLSCCSSRRTSLRLLLWDRHVQKAGSIVGLAHRRLLETQREVNYYSTPIPNPSLLDLYKSITHRLRRGRK